MTCKCYYCERSRTFDSIISRKYLNKQDKQFLQKTFRELFNAEDDADYWKLIANGQWPTLKENKKRFLKNWFKNVNALS